MPKTTVSRCTLPKKEDSENLYVKVKNENQKLSRQFTLNAYSKTSPTKESLPVYLDNQPTKIDTLEPGAAKVYTIDVSSIKGKGQIIFEVIQKNGSSGIKVSKNSKNLSSAELHIR